MEALIRTAPDDFQRVMSELSRILNMDASTFRRARRLRRLTNGAYLETNMSAAAIHRICIQALEIAGIGPDEWHVEYVALRGEDDDDREDQQAPTHVQSLQNDFWTKVREALIDTGKFWNLRAPWPKHWYDIAIGRTGFWLRLTAGVKTREVNVRVMMNDPDGALIAALKSDQAAIEREVDVPLEWNPRPDKKQKSVNIRRETDLSDSTTWPASIEWMCRQAVAMKAAFGRRIATLE